MKTEKKTKILEVLRYLPLIFMAIFFVYFAFNFRDLSVKDILNYTPSNYFLAGFIMIVFFAIKSISIVIPLTILYVSSSIIFSPYWAIVINLIGLFVTMTIPYYIGKFSGKDLLDKLISKYPKINNINHIKSKNPWLFVFFVKILGFIPNDISSIVLGSFNTDYKIFVVASVLAKTPSMLAKTLIAANIDQPDSKAFKVSIFIGLLVLIFTGVVYWINKNKE